jgi:hypothetical protein
VCVHTYIYIYIHTHTHIEFFFVYVYVHVHTHTHIHIHTHTHTHNRDTMVVVWNARSAIPVRTFFDAHQGGIISLDITPDAMYIATVGAGANQDLSIWEWTVQSDEPMCTSSITSKDVQHCVRFKRDDYTEIITNGSVLYVCMYVCKCVGIIFTNGPFMLESAHNMYAYGYMWSHMRVIIVSV